MDPLSHVAAAVLVTRGIVPPGEPMLVPLLAAAAVSQLPDFDFIAKKMGPSTLFLRLHHRMSHSPILFAPIGIAAAWLISCVTGYESPGRLFLVMMLAFLSHALLDATVQGSGISLYWPFSDRTVSWALILGPHPLTSSANCARRRLTVCLRCQLHGSLYMTMFYLLLSGALLSVMPWIPGRVVAIAGALLGGVYLMLIVYLKSKAFRLWREHNSTHSRFSLERVVPGGYRPWIWFGLAEDDSEIRTAFIDARGDRVFEERIYRKDFSHPLIEPSKQTRTVRDFLAEAMVPHVTVESRGGVTVVKWREMSYAFSPEIELFVAKVVFDSAGGILSHEFRERWAEPPGGPATTL